MKRVGKINITNHSGKWVNEGEWTGPCSVHFSNEKGERASARCVHGDAFEVSSPALRCCLEPFPQTALLTPRERWRIAPTHRRLPRRGESKRFGGIRFGSGEFASFPEQSCSIKNAACSREPRWSSDSLQHVLRDWRARITSSPSPGPASDSGTSFLLPVSELPLGAPGSRQLPCARNPGDRQLPLSDLPWAGGSCHDSGNTATAVENAKFPTARH